MFFAGLDFYDLTDSCVKFFAGGFDGIGIESAFHALFGDGCDVGMDKSPVVVEVLLWGTFLLFGNSKEDTKIGTGALELLLEACCVVIVS